MNRVHIQYYALLREQSGRSEETVTSTAASARELYAELRTRHGFSLPEEMLRVVLNEEFVDWGTEIRSGDTVVFIPPVAGG